MKTEKTVYLDNGATTRVLPAVANAMQMYLLDKFGNASSMHSYGRDAKHALSKARETIAKAINADPDEIIFTSCGTESNNWAIKQLLWQDRNHKDHIITTKIEHPSVLKTCQWMEKQGFKVTYLDVNKEGIVDVSKFRKAINDRTVLVTIMHANNEIGTIQPIEEIGAICRQNNIIFHTDAVQSFTKVPIDVKKMNIDLLSLSAHKIHGPKGIGALYVRRGYNIRQLLHGGHQESGLRAGTENVSEIVGFAKASESITRQDVSRISKLRDYFVKEMMKRIPDTRLNGSAKQRLCNNANISFKYIEGESLLLKLDEKGIAVSTGSACSSRELEPSHVLLAIGLKHEEAHGSIRFTLSKETTMQELDYTLDALEDAVKGLREISPLGKRRK